ncbi:glycosyltransferase family 4 protein [Aurantibacillus circumpalustris]|uniref:glycosyltransferase family 4 protein n=1 Tax=Aurantibacillus circumpalustris TaxID=3036359 RepID=UPI00295C1EDA|nr:glycosyltransferase [Aurantibacillus circumpalustris]
MKVLFLYTELAEYFLKCCEELTKFGEVAIIRWPVNKEAPFKFSYSEKIKVYDKNDYSFDELKKLVEGIQPNIILCSGWIDKDYLKIAKPYFCKVPTVLTCDTHWRGSIKQYLAVVLSRFFLLNTFSHAWVPGEPQTKYVKKLGFKTDKISQGFYSCDLPKFNVIWESQHKEKELHFPKVFLYVGRYYEFKGLNDLWQAFTELQQEKPSDWELWCLGTGDISPIEHPKIKHFGFVQPKDLEPILEKSGVFVLPSRFEPWGVVVQEYAAAGFPMLLSTAVGAGECFLEEGKNGFFFSPQNVSELKKGLKKMANLSSKELNLMSEQSHLLAQKISPEKWANTVKKIYEQNSKK